MDDDARVLVTREMTPDLPTAPDLAGMLDERTRRAMNDANARIELAGDLADQLGLDLEQIDADLAAVTYTFETPLRDEPPTSDAGADATMRAETGDETRAARDQAVRWVESLLEYGEDRLALLVYLLGRAGWTQDRARSILTKRGWWLG